MPVTHRVTARYATRLSILRASIESLTEGTERDVLLGQLDDLAGLIGMGFAPLEAVELDEERAPTPGDEVRLDTIEPPASELRRTA